MIIINDISTDLFSIDGINYFKNYVSVVSGNQLKIINCYNSNDVKIDFANYNNFTVNGLQYTNVSSLQNVLLPILYKRNNIANTITLGKITRHKGVGNYNLSIWEAGDIGIGFLDNGVFLTHCYYTGADTNDTNALVQDILNWNGDTIDSYINQ